MTAGIAVALGVAARVLPMSDQPVRTRILGRKGGSRSRSTSYATRRRPRCAQVAYAGADTAAPAPGVLETLRDAGAVIVCPSNPITSIGPILAVPGIRRALEETPATVVAVSPIIGGEAVSGPAGRLMAAAGLPVSAVGVAQAYAPWLDLLVVDERDADLLPAIAAVGARAVAAPTLMTGREAETALARRILACLA